MFIESRIFVETVEIYLTWFELSRSHFFGWFCLKTVELGTAKSSRVLSDEKVEIHRNLVETVKIYAKMFRTKHTELWPRLSKIAVSISTLLTIFLNIFFQYAISLSFKLAMSNNTNWFRTYYFLVFFEIDSIVHFIRDVW